ncbi:MAG: SDR family NAD(P)-dependent oxidoreductase, partial [Planctomycetota bacterium]
MSDAMTLEGAVVLVVGADRAIGRGLATAAAAGGARLALVGQRESVLEEVAAAISSATGRDPLVQAGRTVDETVAQGVFKRIQHEYGRLDALVCDTALARDGGVERMPVTELRRHLDLAVVAPYIWMQKAIAAMQRQRPVQGRIVHVGSVRGRWVACGGWGGDVAAYAALRGMCESITRQLHDQRLPITVSLVLPGHGEPGDDF